MKHSGYRGLLCAILTGTFSFGATGQDDLLKGPEVKEIGSIVRHTMSGRFEQIEGRPEMAAFGAVTDDSALMNRAIEIELERTVAMSMLLIDQIDLMKESTDAVTVGDNKKANEIQGRLHGMFDPEKRFDPLTPGLVGLLDEEQQAEYERVLGEYWEAWIDGSLGERMDREKAGVRKRTQARLTTRLFNRELREAYDISLKQYRDAMEAIYVAVEPSDEQREAMREILIAYIKETRLDPSSEQRRAAMVRMYEVLDQERQQKLFGYLLRIVVPDDG